MSSNTTVPVNPILVPAVTGWDPDSNLKLQAVDNPLPNGSLGAIGRATQISGPAQFELTTLLQPYDPSSLTGLDPHSVRFFKWDEKSRAWQKVWNSGINRHGGFIWVKISTPGTFIPIGLPEDPLLRESLFRLAGQRTMANGTAAAEAPGMTLAALDHFLNLPDNELAELRDQLARANVATASSAEMSNRRGRSAHIVSPALPGNASLSEFRSRIKQLDPPPGGLAEESLFHTLTNSPVTQQPAGLNLPLPIPIPFPHPLPCWLISSDWWMYHHDESHSGSASGCSAITSTSVASMAPLPAILWTAV